MFYTKVNISLEKIDRIPYKGLYRPHIVFNDHEKTSGLLIMGKNEFLNPGENYSNIVLGFYFYDSVKKHLKEGVSFEMYEGSTKIGYGKIIEIIGVQDDI